MMTPAEAIAEIEARKINLVHSFDAFWHASVDLPGSTPTTKKRAVKNVSVIVLTPVGAVESLCAKLDAEAQERTLFEEEAF